jgi:methionyl-tRNA formyltransferase
MSAPSFAIVTAGDLNGRRLSYVLDRLGIDYQLYTVAHPMPPRGSRPVAGHLMRSMRARLAANAALRALKQRLRPAYSRPPTYLGMCNGPTMVAALSKLRPDYVLMMGGGILTEDSIATAGKGVLNVHPGLLPWIRGVDVIRHAMLRGIPVGVTAHFIDAGIDTGDVIDRRRLRISPGDNYASIEARADAMSVALMAALAEQLRRGGMLTRQRQSERFPLCRPLTAEDSGRADRLIEDGAAARLFDLEPFAGSVPDGDELLARYDAWWPPQARF